MITHIGFGRVKVIETLGKNEKMNFLLLEVYNRFRRKLNYDDTVILKQLILKGSFSYSCDEVDTFLDKVIIEFENFSKKMLNFRIRLLQQKRHLNITRIWKIQLEILL